MAEYSYAQNETNFQVALTKIKATQPDVLYVPGYYEEVGTVNSFAQIFSCSIDMAAQVPLPASARHLNSNHSARTTFAY